jgi:CubicO group peptidase (beta-lactamase class C family)
LKTFIGTLAVLVCSTAFAQTNFGIGAADSFPKHDFKAWPDIVAGHFENQSVAGYSFLARYHGMIVVSHVGGYARMPWEKNGPSVSWTAAKPMELASVSKSITAVAIMKLWEEKGGSFSLDTPFLQFLNDTFPGAADSSRQITIRQLLTHRSGLHQVFHTDGNMQEAVDALASNTNKYPGTSFFYNNLNFYLLRLVIEHISGEPYTQYVRNHVLIPAGALNMDTKPEATLPTLVYKSNQDEIPGYRFGDYTKTAGPAGWYGSTLELTAFLYNISNGKILSKEVPRRL